MTIEEVKSAIERRGYGMTIHSVGPHSDNLLVNVYRNNAVVSTKSVSLFELRSVLLSVGDYVEGFVLPEAANGQRHVWCKICHEPLLQERVEQRMQRPLYSGSQAIGPTYARFEWKEPSMVYRSAKAGPDSAKLEYCPTCRQDLSENAVEKVKDE